MCSLLFAWTSARPYGYEAPRPAVSGSISPPLLVHVWPQDSDCLQMAFCHGPDIWDCLLAQASEQPLLSFAGMRATQLTGCMRLQQLTNTGTKALTVPYTLAIYSPSYALIAGQAWNWGVSGSATNGTFSGPVSMVRAEAVLLFMNAYSVPSACMRCQRSAPAVRRSSVVVVVLEQGCNPAWLVWRWLSSQGGC